MAIGTRLEYYHDGRGVTTGVGGNDVNYYETTVGVQVSPLPDSPLFQSLTLRPEVRYDASDQQVFDLARFTQVTGGHRQFTGSSDLGNVQDNRPWQGRFDAGSGGLCGL